MFVVRVVMGVGRIIGVLMGLLLIFCIGMWVFVVVEFVWFEWFVVVIYDGRIDYLESVWYLFIFMCWLFLDICYIFGFLVWSWWIWS